MVFSFTGLSYLAGSVVLFLLALRFFRYWRQEHSVAGRMLFFFVLFLLLFFMFTATLSLFFAHSAFLLKFVTIAAIVLQGISLSFLGYLLLRMKAPSVPPLLGPVVILLASGISAVIAVSLPYAPRLDAEELIIQWNVPLAVNVPRMIMFLLTFLPLSWVFFQEYRVTQEPKAKNKALGLAVVMLVGFAMTFFDFVLERIFGLSEAASDILLNIVFGVLIVAVLFPSWFWRKEVV